MRWWAAQRAKNGYSSVGMFSTPGVGGAALWLALDMVQGATPPKSMIMPAFTVNDDNLATYSSLKPGTMVNPTYDHDWVKAHFVDKK